MVNTIRSPDDEHYDARNMYRDEINKYMKKYIVFFIIPTDAHNYKITRMLKTIKIPTIAPTCFGSRRYHHQVPHA